jgi:hypothetical protein
MKRIALLAVVVAAALTIGVGISLAQGGTAPIYRNTGHTCATGALDTNDWVGHFFADVSNHQIHGSVSLTGVARNATFTIVLVQNHPCRSTSVGTLVTDGQGNGTLDFTAAAVPGATVAWISTSHNSHQLASTTIPLE